MVGVANREWNSFSILPHDSNMTVETTLTKPRDARRRPTRPSAAMVADMTRWAEYAQREPLWAATAPLGRGKSPRRAGGPSKVTADVVGPFLMAARAGNYRETAARFAGISDATLYRWLRDPRPEFAALREALVIVEAEVECEVTANLVRLALRDTKAAIFWLQNRYPQRWLFPGRRPHRGARRRRDAGG